MSLYILYADEMKYGTMFLGHFSLSSMMAFLVDPTVRNSFGV